jgi:hypothetical protein
MRQFTAVPPIGLDLVAILLRYQTWRSDQTRNSMSHQSVMKPEAKISSFIDRLQAMFRKASQNTLRASQVPGILVLTTPGLIGLAWNPRIPSA